MKRVVLLLAILPIAAVLGACGAGEVTVQAQLEGDSENAEPMAIEELEVWLLPYDRDAIFDSLEAAYPEPQPEIPDSLLALQDRMAAAQDEWQAAEREWNVLRDSLKTISDELEGLNRGDAEYMVLYRDFNRMEPRTQDRRRTIWLWRRPDCSGADTGMKSFSSPSPSECRKRVMSTLVSG